MTALTIAERIESLKSGLVGSVATAIAAIATHSITHLWLADDRQILLPWYWLVNGAIALITGFLFGVTYRYIIRDDANPHLKTGGVLAFSLVRGLAQIQAIANPTQEIWELSLPILESLIWFSITQAVLDISIAKGWLKAFGCKR